MRAAIGGIDHLVIVVDHLDAAAQRYRRLGFTLSPKGVHSASMGSANHTIMLQDDYFELLGIVAATDRNKRWRDALARGEGLAGLAVETGSADRARELWSEGRLDPTEVIDFARPVDRPDGSVMQAAFRIASLPDDGALGLGVFACEHLTREAVWLPELMDHPNTATGVLGITLAAPDPDAAAVQWRRVLPEARVVETEGGTRVIAGRHQLTILSHAAAADLPGVALRSEGAHAVAITFAVRDPARCRAFLKDHGVPAHDIGAGIVIPGREACGVALVMKG